MWIARVLIVSLLSLMITVPAGGAADPARSLSQAQAGSGARPGPDVRHAPPPRAPQLEHRDPWFRAAFVPVSGTETYADGEYLYTDHLYDDYGSDTDGAPPDPRAARVGDLTYPTAAQRYAGNAADLVEFRVAPRPDAVAYRITLNALRQADTTIVAIAFDTDRDASTGAAILPRDPGAPFPGTDEVITVWGTGAEHSRLSGDATVTTRLAADADLEANQLTVVVPRTVSDPSGAWRATIALGLYDRVSGGWLRPGQVATTEAPGGAGSADRSPTGIFNLGFRFDEPYLGANVPADTLQALALREHDPTRFAHDLNFDALAGGVRRTTVPETGTQVRIFASRLDTGEGRDLATFPAYRGQLQPYSLTVPSSYEPGAPAGFVLNLHSLGQQHWQYHGSEGLDQLGTQRDAIVATPLARGPDGWYQHEAEYDVFEVWNDVERHFSLDPDRVAISGYSMGGYGTYRLATRYPDLFGKALTEVAPPGEGVWLPPAPPSGAGRGRWVPDRPGAPATLTNLWLENARNVPFLNVAASADQLVPLLGPRAQNLGAPEVGIRGFDQLGYRFRFLVLTTAEHVTLAALGYDLPQSVEFLGDARVDRAPPHVTFAAVPGADDPRLGLVADHAYWVCEVRLARVEPITAKGVVDAFSHGFGVGDPPSARGYGEGLRPVPYLEVNRTWGDRPEIPRENRLDVTLTNVASARLDLAGARIDPARELRVIVTADTTGQLYLDGAFPPGGRVLRDGRAVAPAGPAGATIPFEPGTHTYQVIR